jgi:hypothetical protein
MRKQRKEEASGERGKWPWEERRIGGREKELVGYEGKKG